MDQLPKMTWRRFSVLVRCLSPTSATIAKLSSGQYIGGKREDKVRVVSGKRAAQAAFDALFKPLEPA